MKKMFSIALIMVLALGLLTGCAGEKNTYTDGSFTAFSDEGRGWVKVQITVTNDEITAMDIWEYSNTGAQKDYATYGTPADGAYPVGKLKQTHESLVAAVLEAKSADIDVISGATSSSNKTIQAVERALELARVTPASTTTYFDGKFAGAVRGDRGAVIAIVTIENDVIKEVVITETSIRDGVEAFKDANYGNANFTGEFVLAAHKTLAAAFVAANGTDIDAVSGATSTSTGAIEAVKAALANAAR